jgi:hypothetical protein
MVFQTACGLGAPLSALQTQPREFRSHCATTMWAIPSAESFPFPSSGKLPRMRGSISIPVLVGATRILSCWGNDQPDATLLNPGNKNPQQYLLTGNFKQWHQHHFRISNEKTSSKRKDTSTQNGYQQNLGRRSTSSIQQPWKRSPLCPKWEQKTLHLQSKQHTKHFSLSRRRHRASALECSENGATSA